MTAVTVLLEGVDGCGKTETGHQVATQLRGYGLKVMELADPGSTRAGVQVRRLLGLDGGEKLPLDQLTRFLLYQASRVQTEQELLRPALDHADVVLLDRWVPSSWVYQSMLGGIAPEIVAAVVESTCHYLTCDVALYLHVDAKTALGRLKRRDVVVPRLADVEREVAAYDVMVHESSGWQGDHWHELNASYQLRDVVTSVVEVVYGMFEAARR